LPVYGKAEKKDNSNCGEETFHIGSNILFNRLGTNSFTNFKIKFLGVRCQGKSISYMFFTVVPPPGGVWRVFAGAAANWRLQ